ncbi:MAG: alpha/beta hydrolase [Acidimicrobiia bacterium]|nr:alpha/beta hydrolase [Acidimicrobiia bacterium]
MIVETRNGPVSLDQVGEGPDLVMLHSLLSDRHVFDLVVPRLAERHRISLVDLPGFGSTPLVDASLDLYGDCIGGLLEAGDFDPEVTTILGNGLGGFTALATAVRHGDRFNKLILVGCGSSVPPEGKPAFRAMIDKVEKGGMEAVVDLAIARIFPAEFIEANPAMAFARREVLLRTDPVAFQTACQAIHDADYDSDVAGITNPTLLVVGSEDLATPPALSQSLAKNIRNATYVELEGVAHGPQLQAPDRFLAAIGPFLEA